MSCTLAQLILTRLKDQLSALKVVDCGIWHEQVAREKNSRMPKLSTLPDSVRYKRVTFCDKQTRDHLGCAHTSARCKAVRYVEDIIALLAKEVFDDEALLQVLVKFSKNYKASIKKLEEKVIKNDIQKSNLELAHAQVCEKIGEGVDNAFLGELMDIEAQIASVIVQHKQINAEIMALQKATIEGLNSLERRVMEAG